ncbi:class I SAM-dependent methyltransferase [Paraburkholderia hospita]|uniref:class I SAM-dependent methyltransferase n=1 Tax=Paraburkholderia hospita TaxID=169430 RepID=UPI0009A8F786|nr:class I SAM-dependent methyltransferase [Paraburkholderia hospita]SKC63754.1 Ubiquinone/menaquinone biosynthesis C-methylase UbiE [Paraburkholderia hospita]
MQNRLLLADEILRGYDAVCALYPHVPPLSHWRAWEYAAYQHHRIDGRVLDLGCGDGRYFRLIWPNVDDVVGVDMNPAVAELGRKSGVYSNIHVALAQQVPEPDESFDHVFANCSLEHMDHLELVLAEIHRCLKPGGTLLCSVVTDRMIDWSILPNFVEMAGFSEAATALRKDFSDYHNLVNPLPPKEWEESFRRAGLIVDEHIPLLPKHNGGIFLLMDTLWHVKRAGAGEMGDVIYPFLSANPNFASGFRKVFAGLLEMETDWHESCGAVFQVRKPE